MVGREDREGGEEEEGVGMGGLVGVVGWVGVGWMVVSETRLSSIASSNRREGKTRKLTSPSRFVRSCLSLSPPVSSKPSPPSSSPPLLSIHPTSSHPFTQLSTPPPPPPRRRFSSFLRRRRSIALTRREEEGCQRSCRRLRFRRGSRSGIGVG